MPIPIYSISVRGRDLGGQHRCATKEEAQFISERPTKQDAIEETKLLNDAALSEVILS